MFLAVSLAIPSIKKTEDLYSVCDQLLKKINKMLHVCTGISHVMTVVVRIIMAYYTVLCGVIWSQDTKMKAQGKVLPVTSGNNEEQEGNQGKARTEVSKKYYKIMRDYKERTKVAKEVYNIFRSWSVVQAVLYILEFVPDMAEVFRASFIKEEGV